MLIKSVGKVFFIETYRNMCRGEISFMNIRRWRGPLNQILKDEFEFAISN
jgi:hypothetical protein